MPFVSHGLLISTGPKNISYIRKVSAPYLSTTSSGLTTLSFDFDIFSTTDVVLTFKFDVGANESLYHWPYLQKPSLVLMITFLNFSLSLISLFTSMNPSEI